MSLVWFIKLFDIKVFLLRKVYEAAIREFLWKTTAIVSVAFLVTEKLNDSATAVTQKFHPMLFEI